MRSLHSIKKALKKMNFKARKAAYIAAETRTANEALMDIVADTFVRHMDMSEYFSRSEAAEARIANAKKAPFWVYMKKEV